MADYTNTLKLESLPSFKIETGFKPALKSQFIRDTRPTSGHTQVYPRGT